MQRIYILKGTIKSTAVISDINTFIANNTIQNSFCEEVERVFDKFPKYHMKIRLGDFNAKVGKEDIFKPTIGNEKFTRNQ
jgi:hypothetical protein